MSGAESSVTFALRELRSLAHLRLTEAAEAWRVAEQARRRAAEQQAEHQAQREQARAAAERAEQERKWAAALAENQRAAEYLASVERTARARALSTISLQHAAHEAELSRLRRARLHPPRLVALTLLLLGVALLLMGAAWRHPAANERWQRALAEDQLRYEQAWLDARARAIRANERAAEALNSLERSIEGLRDIVAKPAPPKPTRRPRRPAPAAAPAAPKAPLPPAPIRLSPECLTQALC